VPVKWALAEMGLMTGGIRLPLVGLSSSCHEAVRSALHLSGVIQ
jgi:4-hydroxy-tetrahydrodipicolinate synthase